MTDITKPYIIILTIFMGLWICFVVADIANHHSPSSQVYTDSSIYNKNSNAYALTQLDVGSKPSELSSSSDFDRYNKIQALLNEVETSFKPRTGKATIADMTITAWKDLKTHNKNISLLELLETSTKLDKQNAGLITYAEYLTSVVIMTE